MYYCSLLEKTNKDEPLAMLEQIGLAPHPLLFTGDKSYGI
jgi:hypothetical protein